MIKTRASVAIFYGTLVFRVTLVGRRCLVDHIYWSKFLLHAGYIIHGWLCVCVCVFCTSVYYPNCIAVMMFFIAYINLTPGILQRREVWTHYTYASTEIRTVNLDTKFSTLQRPWPSRRRSFAELMKLFDIFCFTKCAVTTVGCSLMP